jgi:hypothetical protein
MQFRQDQFSRNSGLSSRVRVDSASILNLSPAKGHQRIAQGVQLVSTLGNAGHERISEAPVGATESPGVARVAPMVAVPRLTALKP